MTLDSKQASSHIEVFIFFFVGNAVVVKPSEVSVHTSNLFVDLIPKYLDQVCPNYTKEYSHLV